MRNPAYSGSLSSVSGDLEMGPNGRWKKRVIIRQYTYREVVINYAKSCLCKCLSVKPLRLTGHKLFLFYLETWRGTTLGSAYHFRDYQDYYFCHRLKRKKSAKTCVLVWKLVRYTSPLQLRNKTLRTFTKFDKVSVIKETAELRVTLSSSWTFNFRILKLRLIVLWDSSSK